VAFQEANADALSKSCKLTSLRIVIAQKVSLV